MSASRTRGTRLDAALLGLLALAAYWFAWNGRFMHFNYHLHLSIAFLEGRLHVPKPPPWLTEFAYSEGRAYVYFDPFPAVLLLPFAWLGGDRVNIALVSIALAALNVAFMRIALGGLGVSRRTANLSTLLFAFGTVHLFAAQYGNTWLLAHLCAVAGLTLAWIEATGEANPWILGIFSAIAATSRSPSLLGAPVFLALALRRRPSLRTAVEFGIPLAATALLLGFYNHARFGEWTNNGYLLANEALLRPPHGSFSLRYVLQNVEVYFLRFPGLQSTRPWLTLTDHGLGLVATTPAVLLLLRRGWSDRAHDARFVGRLALAACAATLFLYLCYFWDGWRQFGARYTLDFTPFLVVALALRNDDRDGLRAPWIYPALVALSIAVNAWGAWWWRAHDW
ncbi:hypothetical protein KGQ64_06935 [bacterium]|nr:hypothetical protein [bacterium]